MGGRTKLGWALVIGSAVGWPLTALTIFSEEPQGILGLSWLAILLTGVDILLTAEIHDSDDDDEDG